MDIKAAKEKIRSKIRSGMKTSAIINEGEFPIDLIKSVKSEELELDKKIEKEVEQNRLDEARASKEKKRDEEFMRKYDLENGGGNAGVQAGAQTVTTEQGTGAAIGAPQGSAGDANAGQGQTT